MCRLRNELTKRPVRKEPLGRFSPGADQERGQWRAESFLHAGPDGSTRGERDGHSNLIARLEYLKASSIQNTRSLNLDRKPETDHSAGDVGNYLYRSWHAKSAP